MKLLLLTVAVLLLLADGCGSSSGEKRAPIGVVEDEIQAAFQAQASERVSDARVGQVDCVGKQDDTARCIAVVKARSFGTRRVGIEVTFSDDGTFLWESDE